MYHRAFRFTWRHSFVLLVLVLLTPWTVGCGGKKGTVHGSVTLDGQPLALGTISFLPKSGAGATAQIQDGKYTVERVPTGPVTVTVETASLKEEMASLATSGQSMNRSAGGRMSPEMMAKMPPAAKEKMEEQKKAAEQSAQRYQELKTKYREVPSKYAEASTSPLTFEVKGGDNTYDVTLTSQ